MLEQRWGYERAIGQMYDLPQFSQLTPASYWAASSTAREISPPPEPSSSGVAFGVQPRARSPVSNSRSSAGCS